jgi:hypothetical protein
MAPARSSEGERIAGLEAKFSGYEKYSHERWHDLNNTLQLLVNLPAQMTRDIAKLEGKLEAKIDGRLTAIESRLTAIEGQRRELTGAQKLGVWLVQTIFAAIAVLAAMKSGIR